MISPKRLAAARANGALSHGPKTPEGKARSARNATRHGLLAKIVVLKNENHEAFQALFEGYAERFGPLDDVELGLIEEMVAASWRLRRAFAIETNMMNAAMENHSGTEISRLTDAFGDLASSPQLTVLHRYQARLHLVHSRMLRDLALMRHPVLAAKPAPPEDAESDAAVRPVGAAEDSALPNEPKNPPVINKAPEVEPDCACFPAPSLPAAGDTGDLRSHDPSLPALSEYPARAYTPGAGDTQINRIVSHQIFN